MSKNQNIKATIALIVLMTLLMLSGCRSIRTVEVEKIKTEYRTKTDTLLQKDSVWCHDSVYIAEHGDTVWVNKWHTMYKDRYIYKNVGDTIIKTDSIPVVTEVEKKLNLWEQTKSDFFVPLLGLVLVMGLIIYSKLK